MLATCRNALTLRSPLKSPAFARSWVATTSHGRWSRPDFSPPSKLPLQAKRTLTNPATTRDLPTPERQIQRHLEQDRYDKWGYVIYRTNYDDDKSWLRFKNIITTNAAQQIEQSDAPQIAEKLTWTFFDDRTTFEGASKADLRTHFNRWKQETWQLEQPRAKYPYPAPRYLLFVEVDRGVLDSMPEVLDERALMDISYVNFVDAAWRSLSERCPDEPQEEEFEAVEGCTEEDVGWMKLHAYLIGPQGYDVFFGHDGWYALYVRPPGVVLY